MFAIVRLEGFTLAEAKHTNLCSVSSRSSEDIFMGSFLVLVIKTESRVTPSHKQFMLHMKCGTSTHKHTHVSLGHDDDDDDNDVVQRRSDGTKYEWRVQVA